MTSFTPDAARALGPLPSTDEEVWRYSRIAELDLDAYHGESGAPETGATPTALEGALATVPVRGATVISVNGHITSAEVEVPGVDVGHDDAASVMAEPTDVFA